MVLAGTLKLRFHLYLNFTYFLISVSPACDVDMTAILANLDMDVSDKTHSMLSLSPGAACPQSLTHAVHVHMACQQSLDHGVQEACQQSLEYGLQVALASLCCICYCH
eukprot:scpid29079/ scgid4986/ 